MKPVDAGAPGSDGPPLLGRGRQLAALEQLADAAFAGRGSCAVLIGEPGIGKTRLAAEFSARVDPRMRVVWGRCWEHSGAPPFWPWSTILRTLIADQDDATLRRRLNGGAAWLAPLVPEIGQRGVISAGPEVAPESEHARFAVLDALRAFLRACGEESPLLLVLDDIHCADRLSLLALSHLARELNSAPLLVIGLMRPGEAEPDSEELLASLAASGVAMRLGGLSKQDVATLIEHHVGSEPAAELVQSVLAASAGNPFFCDETIRLLLDEGERHPGSPLPLPENVRVLVRRRLQTLPPNAHEALRAAAVVGQQFARATVQRSCALGAPALLEAFDVAGAAGLLSEQPSAGGVLRFSHGLVREAIYADLRGAERVALHRAVGTALEQRYAGVLEPHLAEIAHHFVVAAPGGNAAKAIDYATRAGLAAIEAHAYEEGARLLGEALELAEFEPPDLERRARLLAKLGLALARRGDAGSRAALLEAAAAARALGDHPLLADVALVFGSFALSPGNVDTDQTRLLEEALQAVHEPAPRARLLSRLAVALYWSPEEARRTRLVNEAIALARTVGGTALSTALIYGVQALRGPDSATQDLAWSEEALAIPGLDAQLVVTTLSLRVDRLLETDDQGGADAAIDAMARVASEQREPRGLAFVPVHRARRALIDGDFAEAETRMAEAQRIAANQQDSTVPVLLAGERFFVQWLRGVPEARAEELRALSTALPAMHVWLAALAVALVERDPSAARALLGRLGRNQFAGVPRNALWLVTLSLAAEVCATLGDASLAAVLYDLLEPYRERAATSPGAGYVGPISRYLGLLSVTLGESARAEVLLREALDGVTARGSRAFEALILLDLARLPDADPRWARAVSELAAELGATGLVARAEAAGATGVPAPRERGAEPTEARTLVREGEFWTFAVPGHSAVRVRDGKGMRHLATLLAHPGVEFAAIDLARERDAPAATTGAAAAQGGLHSGGQGAVGPALDAAAKDAYRARVAELRGEIAEAQEFNDPERAAHGREELEFIARELAAAVGLGGRDRAQNSQAERARVNVTRALRSTIKRIAALDAQLGGQLDAAIQTGTFCVHRPDARDPVGWSVGAG